MAKAVRSFMIPCDHQGNPQSYFVGKHGVTRIECKTENLGDHGITWLDVYEGEDLTFSANAKEVSFVEWER